MPERATPKGKSIGLGGANGLPPLPANDNFITETSSGVTYYQTETVGGVTYFLTET